MACNGSYATAQEFATFWGVSNTCAEERDAIDAVLDVAVSDIHVVLASVGACDCALASWAGQYLKKLTIIDAIVYYIKMCGQPHVSEAMREMYLDWMSTQLTNIATGVVDVCDGATGSQYPVIGWAEQSVTEFAAADIIINDIQRNAE